MSPRPGEVWLADLGLAAKTRPVVIVSRYDIDPPRALVIYVPLTTQNRNSKYEVELPKQPFLKLEGVANVQGIASLPVKRLERKLGDLPGDVLASAN
jgi:mRNA interferase MazF